MSKSPAHRFQIAFALLLTAGLLVLVSCSSKTTSNGAAESAAKPHTNEETAQKASEPAGSQSGQEAKIFLGKPSRSGTTITFPVHFHAATGQKIGLVHLEMDPPDSRWKFLTFDAPPNSRLDVSTEALEDAAENGASRKVEISNGSRVIPNGLIGTLAFSAPKQEGAEEKAPTVRIIDTWPPERSSASSESKAGSGADSGAPAINDPAAKAPENPAMSCFFFSH